MRQIVLDTETTGLVPAEGHRIIEIGCVELINRRITGDNFQVYINPERAIDESAARISNISAEFLQDKPKFFEIVEDFFAYLGEDEIIIHNAPFDVGFINHELNLLGHTCSNIETKVKVIDTLALARRLHPGQRNSLDALCKRYKVNNRHRTFHGALLDAGILAEVYLAMTAGQTNFSFTNDEDNIDRVENFTKREKFKSKDNKLKVMQANKEELAEHNKYLAHIKAKSGGVCIWEQQEQEQ